MSDVTRRAWAYLTDILVMVDEEEVGEAIRRALDPADANLRRALQRAIYEEMSVLPPHGGVRRILAALRDHITGGSDV